MQAAFPEAMVSIDFDDCFFTSAVANLERYAAIAVGPGIGVAEPTQRALHRLLTDRPDGTPLVLDADALNILALHPDWLPLTSGAILTPHEGEYRRLFGDADADKMARQHNLTIVCKAHHTRIYSPNGNVVENHTGNAGMATAGSGDVLTGIILGMLSANRLRCNMFDIVCHAVHIHGNLGDRVVENHSESSLIASDLIDELRNVSTDITAD